jgi:hypothetical protein
VDAASGADVPEAAVLDCVVSSLNACPVVIRLVQGRLLELDVLAMFSNTIFDSVLDIEWIIGVSRVVRSDWHDPCG